MQITHEISLTPAPAAWNAVLALTLCVVVLIASEFLPVSLITPLAQDIGLTEGQAGQAISVSGVFAVLTSLLISVIAGRADRKHVTLCFASILIASGLLVTFAHGYLALMVGRALLGIAVGGFWSLSTAVVMRLVPPPMVPRAIAVLNSGVALASTVAAPLGSFLGGFIGWRGAFFAVIPLGVVAFVWLWSALPSLPMREKVRNKSALNLLRRRQIALGMASILFLFAGQFALFTYLRPFLEEVTRVDVPTLSAFLLLIGLAGLLGTGAMSLLPRRYMSLPTIAIPAVMALVAALLVMFGTSATATAALLIGWGFFSTAAPVGWGVWLSVEMSADPEAGGGLQVAIIQVAIALGAAGGGQVFDLYGWQNTFLMAALLLVGSSLCAVAAALDKRGTHILAESSA